jgi:hypothetical protein
MSVGIAPYQAYRLMRNSVGEEGPTPRQFKEWLGEVGIGCLGKPNRCAGHQFAKQDTLGIIHAVPQLYHNLCTHGQTRINHKGILYLQTASLSVPVSASIKGEKDKNRK